MATKFTTKKFKDIDLRNSFFDSLRQDYPATETSSEFDAWFKKHGDRSALIYEEDNKIGAFLCTKQEKNESIYLTGYSLPPKPRLKISTIKIADDYQGQRLGEGALGLALWVWQNQPEEEIYVTVFAKHKALILLLEKFGFKCAGINANGENVYIRSKKTIDYSNAYAAFPFINPQFDKSGYLIVNDDYHDTLFPFSELKNTKQLTLDLSVANGLSKIYVGKAQPPFYGPKTPILIYRRDTNSKDVKKYKSCVTSFCVVTNVIAAKTRGKRNVSFNELIASIKNKSVFNEDELRNKYNQFDTMTVIEMLYYGFFGKGNNVNLNWLKNNGCWPNDNSYPTEFKLNKNQFELILKEGCVNVKNVIIDTP